MSTYTGIGGNTVNIKGILRIEYLVSPDSTSLKVNRSIYVGKYDSLGAAMEVVKGLLVKNGCRNVVDRLLQIPTTITYLGTSFTTQKSSSGNSVGTMTAMTAASGIASTVNAGYVELQPDLAGTTNSRARLINETDVYGVLAANDWNCYDYIQSRMDATVTLTGYTNANWNSDQALVGFSGSHAGASSPGIMSIEKGCVFRPNSSGKWRCAWHMSTVSTVYSEVDYMDTNVDITTSNNLSILIEKNGQCCTWLINNIPVYSVDIRNYNIRTDPASGYDLPITRVIYSTNSDSALPPTDITQGSPAWSSYVGCDVRRRTASSAQYSLKIYNSNFSTR